jgi:hypothetical protein
MSSLAGYSPRGDAFAAGGTPRFGGGRTPKPFLGVVGGFNPARGGNG